jgi:kynurenine formamidase
VAEPAEGAIRVIGQFTIGGRAVRVDFARGVCIAIPLDFAGPQPSHFGAPPARAEPMATGDFIGDTRRGGSCNVPVITMNPHCNGTHTESVGHIVNEAVTIHDALPGRPIPAYLVTIRPVPASDGGETYRPGLGHADSLITAASLGAALNGVSDAWLEALVIRTLSNERDKQTRRYGVDGFPPFLSIEAIDYMGARGVRHLLVDIPSVDRTHDEGRLTVHHRFWQVPEGSHSLSTDSRRDRTITEMIYVPDTVADGAYLLDLQVPAFSTDAAPSRPWLYPVEFI